MMILVFNSLPNNKCLDRSKLKTLADNKINFNKQMKFVLGRVENIMGKRENVRYPHFLLIPMMFSKGLFLKVVKNWDCVVKGFTNDKFLDLLKEYADDNFKFEEN